MTEKIHNVKAGTVLEFQNQRSIPLVVKVVTSSATECETELHPGVLFKLVAGDENVNVYLLDAAETNAGDKVVK